MAVVIVVQIVWHRNCQDRDKHTCLSNRPWNFDTIKVGDITNAQGFKARA